MVLMYSSLILRAYPPSVLVLANEPCNAAESKLHGSSAEQFQTPRPLVVTIEAAPFKHHTESVGN